MIDQEYLEHILGAIGTITLAVIGWVWRTSTGLNKALIELGICKSDVAKLQTESQHLRDQSIRQDTLVQTAMTQLSKLDKVDTLVSSVEVMRAVVERLERRVEDRRES